MAMKIVKMHHIGLPTVHPPDQRLSCRPRGEAFAISGKTPRPVHETIQSRAYGEIGITHASRTRHSYLSATRARPGGDGADNSAN